MAPSEMMQPVVKMNNGKQNNGYSKNAANNVVYSLPEKQFKLRNSLLTDLFENPHIKTVHHMFVVTLIVLFVNTVAYDYIERGEIKMGLQIISLAFGRIHLAFLLWFVIFAVAVSTYFWFNLWAKVRLSLAPKGKGIQMWDILWIFGTFIFYVFSFHLSAKGVRLLDLPPASACIVVFETTRILMKVHSFVRSNAPKVLNYKPHSDKELNLPTIGQFFYFFFAPCLIYRDEYPRTKEIRWTFVFNRTIEFIAVIFYYAFVFERFINPSFSEFGLRKYKVGELVLLLFTNTTSGILFLLCTFYIFLHTWLNLWAELLRFGDREFYKDWWTCTHFSDYFRTWNIIVHDWLYTYIYKDVYETIAPGNKSVAKLSVFIISAIVHEWLVASFLGFFFPVLFIAFFVFGTLLTFIRPPKGTVLNILFWYGLAFGAGSLISLYAVEFFARRNVPLPQNTSHWDQIYPRLLNCDCFY